MGEPFGVCFVSIGDLEANILTLTLHWWSDILIGTDLQLDRDGMCGALFDTNCVDYMRLCLGYLLILRS